jgi:hypothetical protein
MDYRKAILFALQKVKRQDTLIRIYKFVLNLVMNE